MFAAGNHDAAFTVRSSSLAQYVTDKLVGKYGGSGRNATVENWFTSVH